MAEMINSLGKYAVEKYSDLKSKIKEHGEKSGDVYRASYLQLDEDTFVTSAKVDDDPKTKDYVRIYNENKDEEGRISKITTTFSELMVKGRVCVNFDYLQRMAFGGFEGTARINETFDAETFKKVETGK